MEEKAVAEDTTTRLQAYAEVLGSLSAHNLATLREMLAGDVVFVDPFHRLQGSDAFTTVMDDMFKRLEGVRFEIHQVTPHPIPMTGGFLYWTFSAESKLTGPITFEGVSRIEINQHGLISLHEDYWDSAALYREIPGLKVLFRWLRNRTAIRIGPETSL